MTRSDIQKIVREEIRRVLNEVKKGDKVHTPHGDGVVLDISGERARVKLASGAVVRVHRDRAKASN